MAINTYDISVIPNNEWYLYDPGNIYINGVNQNVSTLTRYAPSEDTIITVGNKVLNQRKALYDNEYGTGTISPNIVVTRHNGAYDNFDITLPTDATGQLAIYSREYNRLLGYNVYQKNLVSYCTFNSWMSSYHSYDRDSTIHSLGSQTSDIIYSGDSKYSSEIVTVTFITSEGPVTTTGTTETHIYPSWRILETGPSPYTDSDREIIVDSTPITDYGDEEISVTP